MPSSDEKLPSLERLQQQIDEAKNSAGEGKTPAGESPDMGPALRMGVELVAGLVVGCVLGYYIDKWLGTFPLFFIICFFLGAAAGFKNLLREAKKMDEDVK